MKEVTLEELYQKTEQLNEKAKTTDIEAFAVRMKIEDTAERIADAAGNSGSVAILTDYDADGICSAYIMQKTLQGINPDLQVDVVCNDRRGAYGVPSFVVPNLDTQYIILDMGSNELDSIREKFGRNTFVIDHHLINRELDRNRFMFDATLLNPHCVNEDDSLNADYCATGLAYRIYTELAEKYPALSEQKLQNTIQAVACIGTITDMVNVADEFSQNRFIIQQGLDVIHHADRSNIDETLYYVLEQTGVLNENTTAKDIAFNTGSFINSASRMSSVIQENGAMLMYQALTGTDTGKIDELLALNQQRKEMVKEIQDERYHVFLQQERFSDNKIAVYIADNIPSAFCGLVAGKLAEATDKAIICLSWHDDTQTFSGSGRNAAGQSSLKEFIDNVTASPEAEGLQIQYGGHTDAIGISGLNDAELLINAIKAHEQEMTRTENELTVLKLSVAEMLHPETVKDLQMLEPFGTGFKLPPVMLEGTLSNARTLAGNESWKSFKLTDAEQKSVKITDWSFAYEKYPLDIQNQAKFLAELSISNFRGTHIECSAVWNHQLYQERYHEIEEQMLIPMENTQKQTKVSR